FGFVYLQGQYAFNVVPLVLLGLWQWHYLQRTFVFPFRMRMAGKSMPILIAFLGFCFNTLNAYLNARFVSELGRYAASWLSDPRFVFGFLLFFLGFVLNVHSDTILRNLRAKGDRGYHLPYGGAYRFVSCPNYFGELLEWLGWAVATWSLSGLAFFVYTAANLIPRARSHHRWYKEKFSDYPSERKAVLPFVY
ncbi:MAG: methyltransferase, partial [Myxococcota bacterium]|nr:methyltransferase [Myxococcota bacterium]